MSFSSLKLARMSIDHFQKASSSAPASASARMASGFVGWNWTQLLWLTLTVWATLLYSGVGNVMGVLPDVAADRMEVRVLAQLRQGGASQTSRWGRSEPGHEVSTRAVASGPPELLHVPIAAFLPLSGFWREPAVRQARQPLHAGLQSRAVPRWHTPLTRAPPF
jgi:hypothetical protein